MMSLTGDSDHGDNVSNAEPERSVRDDDAGLKSEADVRKNDPDGAETSGSGVIEKNADTDAKPMLPIGKYHRIVLLVLSVIETIFMSGILYGWNGLVPVWTAIGIYGCPDNSTSPQAPNSSYSSDSEPPVMKMRKPCLQNNYLSLAFIITSFFQFGITIVCGKFFDRFGLRVTKCLNSAIFFIACIFMGLVSPSCSWFLYPGGILLSFAASFILLCNFQYAFLFPGRESTIGALISGCFDSSAVVFLIFRYAYDGGVPLIVSFSILGVASLILMNFIGIFLLTSDNASLIAAERNRKGTSDTGGDSANNPMLPSEENMPPPPTLREIICGRHYILQVVWFSCILFRFQFFLTAIPQHFEFRFGKNDPAVGRLYQALGLCLLGGCIFAPLAGLIVDHLKKQKSTNGSVSKEDALKAIGIVEVICSSTGVLLTVLIFIGGEIIFYILFILEAFMRSFLFSLNAAFSMEHYPQNDYGVLFGLMFLIGGTFSVLQFAILQLSIVNSNIIVLIFCLISFVQPINLIIKPCTSPNNNNGNTEMEENPLTRQEDNGVSNAVPDKQADPNV